MTKEDWQYVEQKLADPYGYIKLKIDGYDVTVNVEPEKNLKYVLSVYIDGKIKMDWLTQDCEIRQKFYHKHTKSILTAKEKKKLSRERKAVREEVQKRMQYDYYLPYWTSFRSMKSHFIKNNTVIEILEE
ncbi:MAG: hypothetical protein NC485_10335 [Ruminococcus flavefaciens]|nr:hypothetical protein [Ruminococcus flavefaciens]MCM1059295.1 hypothetical protein [Eubacterium sp.]